MKKSLIFIFGLLLSINFVLAGCITDQYVISGSFHYSSSGPCYYGGYSSGSGSSSSGKNMNFQYDSDDGWTGSGSYSSSYSGSDCYGNPYSGSTDTTVTCSGTCTETVTSDGESDTYTISSPRNSYGGYGGSACMMMIPPPAWGYCDNYDSSFEDLSQCQDDHYSVSDSDDCTWTNDYGQTSTYSCSSDYTQKDGFCCDSGGDCNYDANDYICDLTANSPDPAPFGPNDHCPNIDTDGKRYLSRSPDSFVTTQDACCPASVGADKDKIATVAEAVDTNNDGENDKCQAVMGDGGAKQKCVECKSNDHCGEEEFCCNGECKDKHSYACCGLSDLSKGLDCRVAKTKGPGASVCVDGCYTPGADTECKVKDFDYLSAGLDSVRSDSDFRLVGKNSLNIEKFKTQECDPLYGEGTLTTVCNICDVSSCSQKSDTFLGMEFPACSFYQTPGGFRANLVWGDGDIRAGLWGGLQEETRYENYLVADGTFRVDGEGRGNGRGDGGGRGVPMPNYANVEEESIKRYLIFEPGAEFDIDLDFGFVDLGEWKSGWYGDAVAAFDGDVKATAVLKAKDKIFGFDVDLWYEKNLHSRRGPCNDYYGFTFKKKF